MTAMEQVDRSTLELGRTYLLLTPVGWEIGTYSRSVGTIGWSIHGGQRMTPDYAVEIFECPGKLNQIKFSVNDKVDEDDPGHVSKPEDGHWYIIEGASGFRVGKWHYDSAVGAWAFRDNNQNIYDIRFALSAYGLEPPRRVKYTPPEVKISTIRVVLKQPFLDYRVGRELELPETQAESIIMKGIAEKAPPPPVEETKKEPETKDVQKPPANKQVTIPRGRK